MALTLETAKQQYDEQRRFGVIAAQRVGKLWGQVGNDFDAWNGLVARAAAIATVSQTAAAITSADYTPAVLAETGFEAAPVGAIDTTGFSGMNMYGIPLSSALSGAATYAKSMVGGGMTVGQALQSTSAWLKTQVLTAVSDAGRSVVSADIAQRPAIGGYVRMVNAGACPRCAILAGKFYRWNSGFQRHPNCDCVNVPVQSQKHAKDEGFITDPYESFNSLSKAEQDRMYGVAQAQAIRDGADIYRVVNVAGVPGSVGRGLSTGTSWQARRYGTPSKMTIQDIYAAAGGDREKAVELMARNGYITGAQTAGGNILGPTGSNFGDLAAGALGRGGTRTGATSSYRDAIQSGVRDRLNPSTQTAAERRLHRAYLNERAVTEGRNPFSTSGRPITAAERQLVEDDYRDEIADLKNQPLEVRELAVLLGIR